MTATSTAAELRGVRRPFNPLFWTLAQVGSRLRPHVAQALDVTTTPLPPEGVVHLPTRYGPVRTLVVGPPASPIDAERRPVPVVLQLHGGGFVNRYPEQDRHIARHLAATLGAVVVLPDYDTAPRAQYPVAEHEMFDVARWIQTRGRIQGWDGARLLLSGVSAGSKLAINVCQQLHAADAPSPVAVSLIVPFTDATRSDRTSSYARAAISPFVQRSVLWSYFPDTTRRREPLCSPRYDAGVPAAMPPTIIHTGALDTLAAEGAELAAALQAGGVVVRHHTYSDADHDFYAKQPVDTVRELLAETSAFFNTRLAAHE